MKTRNLISFIFIFCLLISIPAALAQDILTPDNAGNVTQIARLGRGQVEAAAFSPDGGTLAVTSSIGVWLYNTMDLGSSSEPPLLSSEAPVDAVAYSPDGSVIASAEESTVRLWDATNQTELVAVDTGSTVNNLVFSLDGSVLYTADNNRMIKAWDLGTATELMAMEGHTSTINALVLSPDGSVLASGADDNTVRLWDTGSGAELAVVEGHGGSALALAYSPDGSVIASGGSDGTARLWDAVSGEMLVAMEYVTADDGSTTGHNGDVNAVAFSPDGSVLVTGSEDRTVQAWETSGAHLMTIETENSVEDLSFSPDGSVIAVVEYNVSVAFWDLMSGSELARAAGHTNSMTSLDFSADSSQMLVGNADRMVWLWDRNNPQGLTNLPSANAYSFSGSTETSLAFAPNNSFVAMVDGFDVQIWEPDLSSQRWLLEGEGLANSLAISPDSSLLIFVGSDGAYIYRTDTGQMLATLNDHTDWIDAVAIAPDQTVFATASQDGTVRIYALGGGSVTPANTSAATPAPPADSSVTTSATLLECSDTGRAIEGDVGFSSTYTCPASCDLSSIWGAGTYTDDSNICTAARHAGIIGAEGGTFDLIITPGQAEYPSTEQNGVTSSSWGSWDRSFAIMPSLGMPVATPINPPGDASVTANAIMLECSTTAQDIEGDIGFSGIYACPANCEQSSIWGTTTYTDDSNICTAAQHAGIIGAEGGPFVMKITPGLAEYLSTEQNGVTSSSWGSWDRSFSIAPAP